MSWDEEQMIRMVLDSESGDALADALEFAERLRVRLLAQLEVLEDGDGGAVALSGAGALAERGMGVG